MFWIWTEYFILLFKAHNSNPFSDLFAQLQSLDNGFSCVLTDNLTISHSSLHQTNLIHSQVWLFLFLSEDIFLFLITLRPPIFFYVLEHSIFAPNRQLSISSFQWNHPIFPHHLSRDGDSFASKPHSNYPSTLSKSDNSYVPHLS
jgi:hypothetical protein